MKKLFFTIILVGVVLSSFASGSGEKSDENAELNAVLIGLTKETVFTLYPENEISRKCNINVDSSCAYYNKMILECLNSTKGNLKIVECVNDNKSFHEKIKFDIKYKKSNFNVKLDLSTISESDYKDFLYSKNANYIVFINKYEFDYKGDPYYSTVHNFQFSIYDREKNKVAESEFDFMTSDLVPLEKLEKKLDRKLKKELKKLVIHKETQNGYKELHVLK